MRGISSIMFRVLYIITALFPISVWLFIVAMKYFGVGIILALIFCTIFFRASLFALENSMYQEVLKYRIRVFKSVKEIEKVNSGFITFIALQLFINFVLHGLLKYSIVTFPDLFLDYVFLINILFALGSLSTDIFPNLGMLMSGYYTYRLKNGEIIFSKNPTIRNYVEEIPMFAVGYNIFLETESTLLTEGEE